MQIKVCGMRDGQNIREVEALGVTMIGLIFWPKSKRCVQQLPDYLPAKADRVGVFVNADVDDIVTKVSAYGLDCVQLHGDEDLRYLERLQQALAQQERLHAQQPKRKTPPRIIRAVRVTSAAAAREAAIWDGHADLLLFETPTQGYGGSGMTFDWQLLEAYQGSTPFLLSGGIGPESVMALGQFSHPRWAGIDLNSRFESAPGMKDINKLREFIWKIESTPYSPASQSGC